MCRIDYADEMWVAFGDSHPRARKAHKCSDCGREIRPGEKYHHAKGLSDGCFYTTKECQQCEAASKWLVAICRGYLFEGIGEELQEHWDEEYQFRCLALGKLCIGHRRRWDRISPLQVDAWTTEAIAYAKRQIPAHA